MQSACFYGIEFKLHLLVYSPVAHTRTIFSRVKDEMPSSSPALDEEFETPAASSAAVAAASAASTATSSALALAIASCASAYKCDVDVVTAVAVRGRVMITCTKMGNQGKAHKNVNENFVGKKKLVLS